MIKHTAGPWHWKALSPSAAIVWAEKDQITSRIYIGDAQLISAAPELLEELKRLVEFAQSEGFNCTDAENVIAKAEGK
jgi:hypothetical protein